MKRETIFLKLAILLIGTPVLALCIFVLPRIAIKAAESGWELANYLYGILIVMYLSAIPFFITLYQAFLLLSYIDKNKAFSESSARALKNIKFCAMAISILYLISMPLFYLIGEIDDAPGVILVGMVLTFAPMVVAVFAAVLHKLFRNAIDIKNDNDLTI